MERLCLTVDILDTFPHNRVTLTGRDAWAMQELIDAGERGCTPIDNPGPRWSGYVFNLRQSGIAIDTVREPHKGAFPGQHARYILRSQVVIVRGPDHQLEVANG